MADKDHTLVVHESATSPGRSATAVSAAATVADQPLPVAAVAPAISGTPVRAANLQATRGSWANDPTGFAYAWMRCDSAGDNCAAIPVRRAPTTRSRPPMSARR